MPKIPIGEIVIDENTQSLIESIIDWAEDNSWFNTDYIYDLHNQLEKRGYLTRNQVTSLTNIIDKFKIEQ